MSRLHSLNSTSEFKKNEQAIAQTSSSLNNQIESLDRKAKASFERITAEQDTVKHLLNGLNEGLEGLNQRRHTLEKVITEQGNQLEALLHREMEYYAAIQDVQQWISALNEHYLSLENAHGNISQQQAENDQNYQTICRIVNEIEVQLKEHTVKLDQLSEGIQALRKRITQLGECLEKLDSEYANNSQRLERMDAELIGIERHFAQVVESFKEAAAEQAFTQGIFVGIICVAACTFGSWALAGKASATASTGAAVKTGGAFQIATKAAFKHVVASAASGMVVRKLGPSNPALAKGLAIVTSICLGGIGESSASDLLKTAAQATAISTASEAVGHSAGPTAGRLMQSVGETLAIGSYTSSASFMEDLGVRAFANEAGHLAAQKAGSRYAPLAGSMVKGIAGGAMENGIEALPNLVKDIFIEALPQAAIVELIKHEHTAHLVADAAKTFAGSYRDHTRVKYVAAGDDPFSSPDDSSDDEEEPLEMHTTKAAEITSTEPSALTLGEIWNRNQRNEEMLPAQIAASLHQLSSKIILEGVRKVCGVHPSVQEKCQQTKEFAAWGVHELKARIPKHWREEVSAWLEERKIAKHIENKELKRQLSTNTRNAYQVSQIAGKIAFAGWHMGKEVVSHIKEIAGLTARIQSAGIVNSVAQIAMEKMDHCDDYTCIYNHISEKIPLVSDFKSQTISKKIVAKVLMKDTGGDKSIFDHIKKLNAAASFSTSKNLNQFAEKVKKGRFLLFEAVDTKAILDEVAKGHSGNMVFMLKGENPIFIKALSPQELAREIVSIEILRKMNLKYASVPKVMAVGKQNFPLEKGMIALQGMPGENMAALIKQAGGSFIKKQRQKHIKNLEIAYERKGAFFAEMHNKSPFKPTPLSSEFVSNELIGFFAKCLEKTNKIGGNIAEELKVLQIAEDFEKNPGTTGLMHGDPHPGNFLWDSKQLSAIDLHSLSVNIRKNTALGSSAVDIAQVTISLEYLGHACWLEKKEIKDLTKAFTKSYFKESNVPPTPEAIRFYRVYTCMNLLLHINDPIMKEKLKITLEEIINE